MMPTLRNAVSSLALLGIVALCGCKEPYLGVYVEHIDHPDVDMIPDGQTAINVCIVILKKIYGDKEIEIQKPFAAKLDRGVWVVTGHFPNDGKTVGGSAYIGIRKKDGKVVFWNHGV